MTEVKDHQLSCQIAELSPCLMPFQFQTQEALHVVFRDDIQYHPTQIQADGASLSQKRN